MRFIIVWVYSLDFDLPYHKLGFYVNFETTSTFLKHKFIPEKNYGFFLKIDFFFIIFTDLDFQSMVNVIYSYYIGKFSLHYLMDLKYMVLMTFYTGSSVTLTLFVT